jgi:sugar lactone lactonase YvrE
MQLIWVARRGTVHLSVIVLTLLISAEGGAPVLAIEPEYVLAVAVDQKQNVYLADRELPGVWRLADGKLSLLFQGSKKFRTPLNAIRCLAIDGEGRLLAGDSATRDVYRFGDDNQPLPLTKGEIGIPMAIAVNKAGDLLVCDLEVHRIWKVSAAGGRPALFAEVAAPRAAVIDKDDRLWIVSHGKDQLLRADASGKVEVIVTGRPFEFPSAVAIAEDGMAYVCDTYAKAVWKVIPGQAPEKFYSGDPLVSPVGMTWFGADLVVADPRAKALVRIDPAGKTARTEYKVEP